MPERFILVLAKEYGQNPSDVEQKWEPFWINRALTLMEAEGIKAQRATAAINRKRARR
jgi:hypothetical protein